MICPNCGNEIAEGHLYCEVCGEEIRMVPDFDIQVEESINVSLSSVAGDMNKPVIDEDALNAYTTKELPVDKVKESLNKKPSYIGYLSKFTQKISVAGIVLSIAIIAVVVISIFIAVRSFSEPSMSENVYAKARKHYDSGEYSKTIEMLRDITDSEDWDYNCSILLSDSYMELHKYDDAIAVLTEAIKMNPDKSDLTRRLMEAYISANDINSACSLLKETDDTEILNKYSDYLPKPPVFSLDSGTYTDDDTLSVMSDKYEEIYFTLDGSEPTIYSQRYEAPFVFDVGEHTITAITANQYGVVSEPVQKKYIIEKKMLDDPVLLTAGGDYSNAELIKLEKPMGAVIYYTDDGSEPDIESNVYNQPIPMPLREKTYKFIMIDSEGTKSRVIEATYNLRMVTLVDVPTAEATVQVLLKLGNKSVQLSEFKGSSAYHTNNSNYYLIDEYSLQSQERVKTGRVFAVDVLTGEVFKIDMSSAEGDYRLQPLV